MRIAIILILCFFGAISSSVLDNDIIPSEDGTTKASSVLDDDIIPPFDDDDATRVSAGVRRWPEGRVPYVMKDTMPSRMKEIVQWAMEYVMRDSNIVFVPRTTQDNYIQFHSDGGCSSSLGMREGSQGLSMGKGCDSVGTASHELLHALGFPHESDRRERDYYVISREEHTKDTTMHLSMYNVFSIMHTSAIPRNDDLKDIYFYSRLLLSHCDWASLNKLYPGKKLPPPCTIENVDDTPYETFPTEHGRNVLGSKADFLCRYDATYAIGEVGEARCQFVEGGFKEWKFPRSIFDPCYGKGPKCEGDRPMWADPSITRPRKKFRPYIPEQGPVACFDMDRNSGGHDIRTITSPNVEACQIECAKNDECRYFTYTTTKSLCWLKRAQSPLATSLGSISGPRRCSCAERRVEYLGEVIHVLKTIDTTACQEECKGRTDCSFYKFDTQFEECSIMTSAYGTMESPTVDSGPKECDGAKPPRGGDDIQPCFERDTAYRGADIKDMPAESALDCQRRCLEDPACDFFTYDKTQGLCWLKKGDMTPSAATQQADNVSGPRSCLECWTATGYWGDDILPSPMTTASAGECQLHCKAEVECSFISFDPSNGLCSLKSSRGVDLKAGVLFGPKICPPATCWSDRTMYAGSEISRKYPIDSVEGCQRECVRVAECKFFTFVKAGRSCRLMSSKGAAFDNEHSISGPRSC